MGQSMSDLAALKKFMEEQSGRLSPGESQFFKHLAKLLEEDLDEALKVLRENRKIAEKNPKFRPPARTIDRLIAAVEKLILTIDFRTKPESAMSLPGADPGKINLIFEAKNGEPPFKGYMLISYPSKRKLRLPEKGYGDSNEPLMQHEDTFVEPGTYKVKFELVDSKGKKAEINREFYVREASPQSQQLEKARKTIINELANGIGSIIKISPSVSECEKSEGNVRIMRFVISKPFEGEIMVGILESDAKKVTNIILGFTDEPPEDDIEAVLKEIALQATNSINSTGAYQINSALEPKEENAVPPPDAKWNLIAFKNLNFAHFKGNLEVHVASWYRMRRKILTQEEIEELLASAAQFNVDFLLNPTTKSG